MIIYSECLKVFRVFVDTFFIVEKKIHAQEWRKKMTYSLIHEEPHHSSERIVRSIYVHIQSGKLTLSACRHYIYCVRFVDKILACRMDIIDGSS